MLKDQGSCFGKKEGEVKLFNNEGVAEAYVWK